MQIPLVIVKRTMTTNAIIERTNRTTVIDTNNPLVIADMINFGYAVAEDTNYHY